MLVWIKFSYVGQVVFDDIEVVFYIGFIEYQVLVVRIILYFQEGFIVFFGEVYVVRGVDDFNVQIKRL